LFGVDVSERDREAMQALASVKAPGLVQQTASSKSESHSERLQRAAQSILFPVFEELEAVRRASARR
jgi:hypothetical protein